MAADDPARRSWWVDELLALGLALLLAAPLLAGRGYCFDDAVALALPLLATVDRAVRAGHVIGWCPDIFGGYCVLGAGQSGLYYPVNWILLKLCGLLGAFRLSYAFHFWLLVRGLLGFARRQQFPTLAVAAVAAVGAAGGAVNGHFMHYNVIVGMAWTGPILWLTAILLAEPRAPLGVGWLAAAVGLSLVQSHPQYVVLALLISLALAPAVRRPEVSWSRAIGRLAAAWSLGGALALAQLVPLAEYARTYPRPHPGGQFEYITAISFRLVDWARCWAPEAFGDVWRGGFDLTFLYWENRAFCGLVFLALAVAWLAARSGEDPALRRVLRAGAALAAVSAFLMTGRYNPVWRLLCWIPPFSLLRAPARFAWPLQLGVALLAGGGLAAVERGTLPRRAAWWGAGTAAGGLLLVLAGAAWAGRLPTMGAAAWLGAALGGAAALAVPFAHGRRGAAGLLAVGLLELALSWHTFALTRPASWFSPPPFAALISADASPRLVAVTTGATMADIDRVRDQLWPYLGTIYGAAYLEGGSEALPPIGVLAVARDIDRAVEAGDYDRLKSYLDRYSVRWVTSAVALPHPRLELAAQHGEARLYRNLDARPWVYAVDPQWLTDNGVVTRRGAHLPWAPVDVTRREPEHWEVRTHFSQPQVVVLSQGLYPGWGARIDGQPTPLNGAEMLFMAVTVPPGEHTVEFTFDNAGIWLGRQLSQIALGAWLVLMLWGAARRR